MRQLYKKWAKNEQKTRKIDISLSYMTQRLKIFQIWLHIRIALEMYFQIVRSQIFAISTPSPLKMASKLANITKITIFTNIDVNKRVNCDIG